MEEKINIAEILKNKPMGTKLYADAFGELSIEDIFAEDELGINLSTNDGDDLYFYNDGKYNVHGEPILFPSKDMRDWRKFAWKKGDVLKNTAYEERVIFDGFLNNDYTYFKGKHPLDCSNKINITYHEECNCFTGNYRLESTDAAQTYINTIEERLGGKLNLETLEIEMNQPEFKDGDIVFMKGIKSELFANCIFILRSEYKDGDERAFYYAFYNADDKYTLDEYGNTKVHYSLRLATDSEKQQLFSALEKKGKAWDAEKKEIANLKPKVDELKPFDRCIWKIRNCEGSIWQASFVSYVDEYGATPMGVSIDEDLVNLIILPYNDQTKLLVGTTDEWKGGEQ